MSPNKSRINLVFLRTPRSSRWRERNTVGEIGVEGREVRREQIPQAFQAVAARFGHRSQGDPKLWEETE